MDLRGDRLSAMGAIAAQVKQHEVRLMHSGGHDSRWCAIDDRADLAAEFVQQALQLDRQPRIVFNHQNARA